MYELISIAMMKNYSMCYWRGTLLCLPSPELIAHMHSNRALLKSSFIQRSNSEKYNKSLIRFKK